VWGMIQTLINIMIVQPNPSRNNNREPIRNNADTGFSNSRGGVEPDSTSPMKGARSNRASAGVSLNLTISEDIAYGY